MKKTITLFFIVFLLLFNIISCNDKSSSPTSTDTSNPHKKYSTYTGEEVPLDTYNQIPFMAIVENSVAARPQSGLSDADIIFETSAEGGIPRFLAVFQKSLPKIIGPIRSVRPYFIDIANITSLPFAHCGGSEEALNKMNSDNSILNINEISNGSYFWRDKERIAPHNLYTSSDKIHEYINNSNWQVNQKELFKFDKDMIDSPRTAESVSIVVNKYYNTSYKYSNNLYTKSMDNKISIDANNNEPLNFSNIIIQNTTINLQPDNIHLDINLYNGGTGYIVRNGKVIDANWKYDKESNNILFYDLSNNLITLSPGKTIWHIIDNNATIKIE